MAISIVIYVIKDLNVRLIDSNIDVIRALTELKDLPYGTTYKGLIDARRESLGYGYGYSIKVNEGAEELYILPSLPMGLDIDPNSNNIKEYTEQEYKDIILPTIYIEENGEIL